MKLAFAYVRIGGGSGGFLLAVRVFWLWLAVLVSKLLGVLFLDHSVSYGDDGTHDK